MAEIVLDDVWKVYSDGTEAVRALDLEIADKEFMVLVGPSGCGKTTALRMVAGLEVISRGAISIGERVVNDLPPKERDIAMVFQNYALYPHMSRVRQHGVRSQARNRCRSRRSTTRVNDAARILGLDRLVRVGSPRRSPAASGSASRWAAPSCATRRRS